MSKTQSLATRSQSAIGAWSLEFAAFFGGWSLEVGVFRVSGIPLAYFSSLMVVFYGL
jgi:hypothetical protein